MKMVCYIRKNQDGRIEQIIGPLAKYQDRIEKLNLHNRRAIVKIPMLREVKEVKFCLWLDKDPVIEWI